MEEHYWRLGRSQMVALAAKVGRYGWSVAKCAQYPTSLTILAPVGHSARRGAARRVRHSRRKRCPRAGNQTAISADRRLPWPVAGVGTVRGLPTAAAAVHAGGHWLTPTGPIVAAPFVRFLEAASGLARPQKIESGYGRAQLARHSQQRETQLGG